MKVISKCVNDNLINELNAYLRHQRICQLALWGKSIEDFEPTEAEKTEYEQIRTYVAEEEAKARTEGYKICWTLPIDACEVHELFKGFIRPYKSIL